VNEAVAPFGVAIAVTIPTCAAVFSGTIVRLGPAMSRLAYGEHGHL
jgi:hypothetical protein